MNFLINKVFSALKKYSMLESGDDVAVALSGGKDSLTLLYTLAKIKEYYPEKFSIKALFLDMMFNGEPLVSTRLNNLKNFCDSLGVPFFVKSAKLWDLIFVERKEKSPCSLCSRMRKGILNDAATKLGCNKIALGHHFDDAVETLILNLFYNGKFNCFLPVTYLSRKNITMIRPLFFCKESSIISFSKKLSFPVLKNECPMDKNTKRQKVKEILALIEENISKDAKKRLFDSFFRNSSFTDDL